MRAGMLVRELDMLKPKYKKTAAYGHFGRSDLNLPWEDVSMIAAKLKG